MREREKGKTKGKEKENDGLRERERKSEGIRFLGYARICIFCELKRHLRAHFAYAIVFKHWYCIREGCARTYAVYAAGCMQHDGL